MFVTTFYSFKGGVGRTMALVNVAVRLAQSGKKILIVDFDLEAPGIPTFSLTAPEKETPGLVEYISDYRSSGSAPNIENYIYIAKKFDSGGELAVMPAGLHNGSYSQRLNLIDWHKLYAEEDGYLFFEDMKRQWERCLAPDYVFIDSRTGHSDVEGICTRQLPDSVCLLFFPNEQNLQGLKRVVSNVRHQNTIRRGIKDPIALHFAVSNVPDLDDEDGIVGSTLQRFQKELGYQELSGQIHHYNSLSLLHQEIFTSARPKSRLAREYGELAESIIKDNIFDRDVATSFLKKVVRDLRSPNAVNTESLIGVKVERILHRFQTDAEIVLEIALIYEAIGRTADALAILTAEICSGSAHRLAVRARLNHRSGNKSEAISDLDRMLNSEGAQVPSLLEALSFASQLDPTLFHKLPNSTVISSLSLRDRAFIGIELQGGLHELNAKYEILDSLLSMHESNPGIRDWVSDEFALTAIGLGKFDRAIEELGSPELLDDLPIDVVFNLGMAFWGKNNSPDPKYFAKVVELNVQSSQEEITDANFFACIAIAYAVLGDQSASRAMLGRCKEVIRLRPRRIFSPWSFTKVPSREFLGHMNEFEAQISTASIRPLFIDTNRQSLI